MAKKTKHIVGFSGGTSSAYVAKMIADKYPGNTVLLFHDTKSEPKDNYRFRQEISNFIGVPITDDSDGRDIWEIFKDEGYLGNGRNTPCSRILKQERSMNYMKNNKPAILYIGFTPKEYRRGQRTFARYLKQGIEVKFPLIEEKITKERCNYTIENCWNIKIPKRYEWLDHANCIPCIKGKKAYWGLIYMYDRKAWERAVKAEKDYGHTIFTEAGSLAEELDNCLRLAKKALLNKSQDELILYPCECQI